MKRICFLVYGTPSRPVGGVKVIFQYANMLAEKGYDVTLAYDQKMPTKVSVIRNILDFVKFIGKKILHFQYPRWFILNKKIQTKYVWEFKKSNLKDFDVYIATAIMTAFALEKLKLQNKKLLYFIQGFEAWGDYSENDVMATYKFPMTKIVISNWLYEIVKNVSEDVVLIENGFDFDYFTLSKKIEDRKKYTVCILNHIDFIKRCGDSFKALEILKKKYPELKVYVFGCPKRPKCLPGWYEYYKQPNKEQHNYVYNSSSIFLNASEQEGWGLTVGEAMICGCAVICADNLGHRIMAHDYETALLFKPRDVEGIVKRVSLLFDDDNLRIRIAKSGNDFIQHYKWENSYKKFIEVIEQ